MAFGHFAARTITAPTRLGIEPAGQKGGRQPDYGQRQEADDGHGSGNLHGAALPLGGGLDVDRNDAVGMIGFQRRFDAVADRMRRIDGHRTVHYQMKVDEGHAAGMAGAEIMHFERAGHVGADRRLDR